MAIQEDWEWNKAAPTRAGWYAVLICWDPWEGFFPRPMRSDGVRWNEELPVVARGKVGPFSTEADAEAWADDHDPEM